MPSREREDKVVLKLHPESRPVFSVLFAAQLLKPFRSYAYDTICEPLIVAAYILSGIFILNHIEDQGNYQYGDQRYEDWSLIDCTYFIAQTMSTVGYGDLAPTPAHGSRVFVVFVILLGIAVIFPILGKWMILLTTSLTKPGRAMMEALIPTKKTQFYGGEAVFEVPSNGFIYYFKNLLPTLVLCFSVQFISAAIYMRLESEQEFLDNADGTPCIPSEPTNTQGVTCSLGRLPWTYEDAIYHCIVTATTVGYGDVRIATQRGRLFASFHMVLSVAMVSDLLSTLGTLATERAQIIDKYDVLEQQLDQRRLLMKLMERAKDMFPGKFHEEKGFTRLNKYEYVMLMITELGIVEWKDVKVFGKQFDDLDTDHSGGGTLEELTDFFSRNLDAKGVGQQDQRPADSTPLPSSHLLQRQPVNPPNSSISGNLGNSKDTEVSAFLQPMRMPMTSPYVRGPVPAPDALLPPGWKAAKDHQTGQEYYYSKELNITQWTHPFASTPRSPPFPQPHVSMQTMQPMPMQPMGHCIPPGRT